LTAFAFHYLRYEDPGAVEEGAAAIRGFIVDTPFPDELAVAIATAYDSLGASCVAVRSSGTAEDLAGASFAGLHDSNLDILGTEAVRDGAALLGVAVGDQSGVLSAHQRLRSFCLADRGGHPDDGGLRGVRCRVHR
jgi:pyruvate,water dikinase